jgi:AcrR family transcriptional regulator
VSQVVRPFRGVPADERRAARRAKLIDAILDVTARDGLAGLKVSAVCQQAGLTERYFYESFANRDEALIATLAEFGQETYAKAVSALASAPKDFGVRSHLVASILIDALLDDPRKARAYVEAIGAEAVRELRMAYSRTYAQLLTRNAIYVYDLDAEKHSHILEIPTLVFIAGCAEMVNHWFAGEFTATRDELLDQCSRMCVVIVEQFVADIRAGQA